MSAAQKQALRLIAMLTAAGATDEADRRAEHQLRAARTKYDRRDRVRAVEGAGAECWQ
jgi:hypothetical protein